MQPTATDRRRFLKIAAGTLAAGWIAARPAAAAAARSALHRIRLGGPIFNPSHDPEELALAHKKLGYRAAYCPARVIGRQGADPRRRPGVRQAWRDAGRGGPLGEPLGCRSRRSGPRTSQKVTEGLALAEAIGARCCVDIAGSFNPKVWFGPHPDNLSRRFLRRRRGKRPQDHRRRPAQAGEVHLRSDGLGAARLARRLPEDDQGRRSRRPSPCTSIPAT